MYSEYLRTAPSLFIVFSESNNTVPDLSNSDVSYGIKVLPLFDL